MVAKESHCTTIREGELSVCGRDYIAEDDLSDELSRMIDELNRKKTPEGLKTSGEIFSERNGSCDCRQPIPKDHAFCNGMGLQHF